MINPEEDLHSRFKEYENELNELVNRLKTTLSRESGNCFHQQEKKFIAKVDYLCPENQIKLRLQLLRTLKTVNKPVKVDIYLYGVKNFILRSGVQLTINDYTKMLDKLGLIKDGYVSYEHNPALVDNLIGFLE